MKAYVGTANAVIRLATGLNLVGSVGGAFRSPNLVERFFNQLKHFRAIATRYDKLARNFLAGVQLAATTILLN